MTEHDYDEGYRAGMQKMRDVAQARIDKLEKVGKVFIDELTKVQARIDKLEQGLRDIKFYSDEEYAIGRATAALKGTDT